MDWVINRNHEGQRVRNDPVHPYTYFNFKDIFILKTQAPKEAEWERNQEHRSGCRFVPKENLPPRSETRVGIGRMGIEAPKFGMGKRGRQRRGGLECEGFPIEWLHVLGLIEEFAF